MHHPLNFCPLKKKSPVHHKLTTAWQESKASLRVWWKGKGEVQHAFTTYINLVYLVIQKFNLNKTRLTVVGTKETLTVDLFLYWLNLTINSSCPS